MAQQEGQTPPESQNTGDGGEGKGDDDRVANIQAEFDRKLANIREDIQNSNSQLLQQVAGLIKEPQAAATAPVAEVGVPDPIDDPAGHAAFIDKRIADGVNQGLQQFTSSQQVKEQQVQTMARMVEAYPELIKKHSALTTKATAIFSTLDESTRGSALGYEIAVTRAAQELGVPPSSLRGENGEFVLSGSGGGGGNKKADDALPKNYEELSRMMGINIDDPKVRERMIKRSKYSAQDWLRYGSGK